MTYFCKTHPQLLMPRSDDRPPDSGIQFQGDVLNGKLSVEEAIVLKAHRAVHRSAHRAPLASDYLDPVLLHHLRTPPEFDPLP